MRTGKGEVVEHGEVGACLTYLAIWDCLLLIIMSIIIVN